MRALTALLLAVLPAVCEACALPVFRHALERWSVADYRLEIPDTPEAAALMRAALAQAHGNLRVDRIEALARAELFAPGASAALWSGACNEAAFAQVLNSPARSELARRILSGDTAVWVVVAPAQRRAALRAELEVLLEQAASAAKLPPVAPGDLGPGPALTVRFSVLELDPGDPAEAVLRAQLAGRAEAPAEFIAPVFGRGRVLGVMKPEQVTANAISQTATFLTGSCSCEINVGWDLLINLDWSAELKKMAPAPNTASGSAERTAAAGGGSQPETRVIVPPAAAAAPVDGAPASGAAASRSSGVPLTALVGGAGVVLILLLALALRRRA